MNDNIKEIVYENINDLEDLDDLIDMIYEDEFNHKHADATDPRIVYERYEIEDMVNDYIGELIERGEICHQCRARINDDDQLTHVQCVPYGESTVPETIVFGHICPRCNMERYY